MIFLLPSILISKNAWIAFWFGAVCPSSVGHFACIHNIGPEDIFLVWLWMDGEVHIFDIIIESISI